MKRFVGDQMQTNHRIWSWKLRTITYMKLITWQMIGSLIVF